MPHSANSCERSAAVLEYHRLTLHREILASARSGKACPQVRRLPRRARPLHYLVALASCLAAVALWGTVYPVYARAMKVLDPITLGVVRNVMMMLVVVPALIVTEGFQAFRMAPRELVLAAFTGCVGIVGFGVLTFVGEHIAGTGPNAAKLTAVYAMAVMIVWEVGGSVRAACRFRARDLTLVCTAYAGLALMISGGGISGLLAPRGLAAGLLVLAGGACWMWYTVLFRNFPAWSVLRFSAVTLALGTAGFAVIDALLIAFHVLPIPSVNSVVSACPDLLYLGIAAGALPLLLWNRSARCLTPVNALMLMSVGTAVTLLISDHLRSGAGDGLVMGLGGLAMLLSIGSYSAFQYRLSIGIRAALERPTRVRVLP